MSKFRPEGRRYYKTGVSGYIGAGNNPLVYTKSSVPSFAKLKQLYGDHLENYHHEKLTPNDEKKISGELKEKIRSQIKKEIRATYRKRIVSLTISLIFVLLVIFILYKVVIHFFPSLL
ncbi:hypothetical protein ACE1ET_17670 [Saccharicrinis sp. FJH62]|uniref:hypothetical protein n=1 Tax=Saccharicrinis sp. FJH62 TaxID=3344657 RepID=UPI0035D472B8